MLALNKELGVIRNPWPPFGASPRTFSKIEIKIWQHRYSLVSTFGNHRPYTPKQNSKSTTPAFDQRCSMLQELGEPTRKLRAESEDSRADVSEESYIYTMGTADHQQRSMEQDRCQQHRARGEKVQEVKKRRWEVAWPCPSHEGTTPLYSTDMDTLGKRNRGRPLGKKGKRQGRPGLNFDGLPRTGLDGETSFFSSSFYSFSIERYTYMYILQVS